MCIYYKNKCCKLQEKKKLFKNKKKIFKKQTHTKEINYI